MSYQEHWRRIEKQLQEKPKLGKGYKGYVRDGVVSFDEWKNQQIRPLFIGKESHAGTDVAKIHEENLYWSITDHVLFGAGEKAKQTGQKLAKALRPSWAKTSYISYALQNNCLSYSCIHSIRHTPSVTQALHNLAFINVGKQVGDKTTSPTRLGKIYKHNSKLLHEQIEICQPNIVIGWNTLSLFESDPLFKTRFAVDKIINPTVGGVRSWLAGGKLFIAAGHPAARVSCQRYVDNIVSIIRNHKEALNQQLPTW